MKFTAMHTDAYSTSVTTNIMSANPEMDSDQPSMLSFSRPIEKGFEDSAYYFEVNDPSYGSYKG